MCILILLSPLLIIAWVQKPGSLQVDCPRGEGYRAASNSGTVDL